MIIAFHEHHKRFKVEWLNKSNYTFSNPGPDWQPNDRAADPLNLPLDKILSAVMLSFHVNMLAANRPLPDRPLGQSGPAYVHKLRNAKISIF